MRFLKEEHDADVVYATLFSLDRLHIVARLLNPGRIHHDSDPLADGLGGKVLGELGSDGAAASVGARHFAPDHLMRTERMNEWMDG